MAQNFRRTQFLRTTGGAEAILARYAFIAHHSRMIFRHPGTPNGRLIFGIFASIAEFKPELIRSRVRSGLAAARAKGKRLGRPRVIVDNPQKISALRKNGASWATICRQTGLSKGTRKERSYACPKTIAAIFLRALESSVACP